MTENTGHASRRNVQALSRQFARKTSDTSSADGVGNGKFPKILQQIPKVQTHSEDSQSLNKPIPKQRWNHTTSDSVITRRKLPSPNTSLDDQLMPLKNEFKAETNHEDSLLTSVPSREENMEVMSDLQKTVDDVGTSLQTTEDLSPQQLTPTAMSTDSSPRQLSPIPQPRETSPRQLSPISTPRDPSPQRQSPIPLRKDSSHQRHSPVPKKRDPSPQRSSPTAGRRKESIAQTIPEPISNLDKVESWNIGLQQLQDQVRRLALRKGFTLNLMVMGRSGLGKTTLVNTLFGSTVLSRDRPEKEIHQVGSQTTGIKTTHTIIEENGVRLNLSITDTPGFGDQIDNSNCWEPALKYIDDQYEKYLNEEQSAHRARYIEDTRIHCCLYFISPTGHRLSALDLEVLKRLHSVVNVVPLMAKADTLTLEEREEFRKCIQEDFLFHRIAIYPVQKYEDLEDRLVNQHFRDLSPFAIVGSENIYDRNGRRILGRQNQWGLVEVENPDHCEFYLLRNMLIKTHMQDLIELTSAIHYESFRRRRLMEVNGNILMSSLGALNESQI